MSKIKIGKTYKFKDVINDEVWDNYSYDASKMFEYWMMYGMNNLHIEIDPSNKEIFIRLNDGTGIHNSMLNQDSGWYSESSGEQNMPGPIFTIPENEYDTDYDELIVFLELNDPEPRKPLVAKPNDADWSFWDNPVTRTGRMEGAKTWFDNNDDIM